MPPDPTNLLKRIDLTTPLIGFYDAPDASPFAPTVESDSKQRECVFSFYQNWLGGETLLLTKGNFGCGGSCYWLGNAEAIPRKQFVKFLVDAEGLKESQELMNRWLDHFRPYQAAHPNLLIGPLREDQFEHLRTITFFVNLDQLSALILGANYNNAPGDPPPVLAPFGSGCMELVPLFEDLDIPQAIVGATDIAMRQLLPPNILAFTVTKPMFELLCGLDQRSFLYKPFWKRLRAARGLADFEGS
jgi:hypothetical protein